MPWVRATAGADNPVRRDVNYYGKPIAINGGVYPKGLWTHAYPDTTPADMVYDVAGKRFELFKADAGLDDASGGGSVQFQVLVDGVQKAESPVLRPRQVHRFRVDVAGASKSRCACSTAATATPATTPPGARRDSRKPASATRWTGPSKIVAAGQKYIRFALGGREVTIIAYVAQSQQTAARPTAKAGASDLLRPARSRFKVQELEPRRHGGEISELNIVASASAVGGEPSHQQGSSVGERERVVAIAELGHRCGVPPPGARIRPCRCPDPYSGRSRGHPP